jgi:DNA replication and repair protein RecF
MTLNTFISQLKLTNFRNYQSRNFNFTNKIVAIYGNNGVGKTNILEAISLLTKGNGIKNAEFYEMIYNQTRNDKIGRDFTIYGKIENHPNIENIGTSFFTDNNQKTNKRIYQTNNKIIRSLSKNKISNKTSLAIIWLTPQMDNLFCSSKTLRRKFLDKIVADIDANHNNHLNLYNHSLKERINLINNFANNQNWLDIVERKIAELGTAIATSRNETIHYLNQAILQNDTRFTKTNLKIIGELEELALNRTAIEVEEKFIEKLKANRQIDGKSGRTNFGVHRSDFTAILLGKEIEAKFCSTGEQKSILIAITFARVKIFSLLNLPSTILLLDEIVSHLDNQKRINLLEEISKLDCQSFLTATNKDFFSTLFYFESKITQFLEIN